MAEEHRAGWENRNGPGAGIGDQVALINRLPDLRDHLGATVVGRGAAQQGEGHIVATRVVIGRRGRGNRRAAWDIDVGANKLQIGARTRLSLRVWDDYQEQSGDQTHKDRRNRVRNFIVAVKRVCDGVRARERPIGSATIVSEGTGDVFHSDSFFSPPTSTSSANYYRKRGEKFWAGGELTWGENSLMAYSAL